MLSINFVPTRRDSHRSRDSSFRRSYFASSKTRYPEREVEASKNPRAALLRPRLKDFCHSSASTRADQILTTVMTRLSLSPPSSLDRSVSLILVARRKNSWRTHVHEGSGERWLLLRDSRLRYRSFDADDAARTQLFSGLTNREYAVQLQRRLPTFREVEGTVAMFNQRQSLSLRGDST